MIHGGHILIYDRHQRDQTDFDNVPATIPSSKTTHPKRIQVSMGRTHIYADQDARKRLCALCQVQKGRQCNEFANVYVSWIPVQCVCRIGACYNSCVQI